MAFSSAQPEPSAWRALPRVGARNVLVFFAVVGLGFAAWPALGASFASAFQGVANGVLAPLTFGTGGHIAFLPVEPTAALPVDRDASWDAAVVLRVDAVAKAHSIAINPRRLLYLPCVFFLACVLAAPVSGRHKAWALLAGAPVLLVLALASLWITLAWLFARVPGLVYTLSPWQRALLHISYEGVVTPIANKFIVPLLLALGIFSWQLVREERSGAPVEKTASRDPALRLPTKRAAKRPQRRRKTGR